MRKRLLVFALVTFAPLLVAQSAMNNDSVIKLCKSGISDDVIVTTINTSAGDYKTSADDLVALKSAGASDKVIAAVVSKAAAPVAAPATAANAPAPKDADVAVAPGEKPKPRVFLRSRSHGNQWNAVRNQSMEMSKDFEKDCPGVRITVSHENADYIVMLNHIEHGWSRDNQVQVANREGDLITTTKEGRSIANGMKLACQQILDDWAKK